MAGDETYRDLLGYLITTAKAHHKATGGTNPQWAQWYSERLVDDVNQSLSSDLSATDLASWLEGADIRYQDEEPEVSWPKAYSRWLIEDFG